MRCQIIIFSFILVFVTLATYIIANYINNYLDIYPYSNILLGIISYLIINSFIHYSLYLACLPYQNTLNPKHLIIIVGGYNGHYIRCRDYISFFKKVCPSKHSSPMNEIQTQHKLLSTNASNSYQSHNNKNIMNDGLNGYPIENESILVYISRCNSNGFFFYSFFKSNDGIEKGGQRLANEIEHIFQLHPSLEKLSIIGCSLGGIFARYAIKILSENNEINDNSKQKNIQFMNFITMASPHTGVQDLAIVNHIYLLGCVFCCCVWRYICSLCKCKCSDNNFGYYFCLETKKLLNKWNDFLCNHSCNHWTLFSFALFLKRWHLFSRTLQQLFLIDDQQLLLSMSDGQYINALSKFRNHVCFCNAKYDPLVSAMSGGIFFNDEEFHKIVDQWWEKMEKKDETFFILDCERNENEINEESVELQSETKEEVNDCSDDESKNEIDLDMKQKLIRKSLSVINVSKYNNDCWFWRLRENIDWKRVIVFWNQNSYLRRKSHVGLVIPDIRYSYGRQILVSIGRCLIS